MTPYYVKFDNNKRILVADEAKIEFKRICGSFGWPDPGGRASAAQYALFIGGIQSDDTITILETHAFSLQNDFIETAIDAKDRLYVDTYYCDKDQKLFIRSLRDPTLVDGLCGYHSYRDIRLTKHWLHEPSFWKNFRDRENKAAIKTVPDDVQAMAPIIFNDVLALAQAGDLTWAKHAQAHGPLFKKAIHEIQNHPQLKALVYLVHGLKKLTPHRGKKYIESNSWYGGRN